MPSSLEIAQAATLRPIADIAAGIGMGMEKFLNIGCRTGDLQPSAGVLVAPVRALKRYGDPPEGGVEAGSEHAASPREHRRLRPRGGRRRQPLPDDTDDELETVRRLALGYGAHTAELNEAFRHGSGDATALAEAVVDVAETPRAFEHTYGIDGPLEEKIAAVAR